MKHPTRTRGRRSPPKIVGNTARLPEPLRSLGTLALSARQSAPPPAGRPGVRNFPRARSSAPIGEFHRSIAVAKFLARRAAAERARQSAAERARQSAAPTPKRKRPSAPWSRPCQETPTLERCPAVARPAVPPAQDVGARAHGPAAVRRNAFVRREHARVIPARPRPSRALAELVAEATT